MVAPLHIQNELKYGLEINKVYNEDCLIGMQKIKDKSIDMILCDLPYGTTQNKWDSIIPLNDYIEIEIKNKIVCMNENEYKLYCFENNIPLEIFKIRWKEKSKKGLWTHYKRIIKDNGVIILTSQGNFTSKLISSNEEMFKYKIIWEKSKSTNFLNSKKQPLRKHEDICVFYKKQPTYNPQMSEGEAYNKGTRKNQLTGSYGDFKPVEVKSNGERYPTDIVYFKTAESEGEVYHPTQKPVELGKYLIKTFTNEGDVILDNTCGSGSFLVSAILEKRNFIGFEKNENVELFKKDDICYIDICNNRIKKAFKSISVCQK